MRTSCRFGCLLVASVLTLAAAPARANHIPGATYTGTAATGGTVSFDVSALGGAITRFAWNGVPTDCGTSKGNFTRSRPIMEHAFVGGGGLGRLGFSGSFPANQQATGTLSTGGFGGGCSVGWTATTTAMAPPPPTSDQIPPVVDIRSGGRLGRDAVLRILVESPEEPCTVTVGGTVSIAGSGRTFRLRRTVTLLPHGANLPFGDVPSEHKLGRRALAAARRALKNGRRVGAKVTVTAVDAAGNRTVEGATIRIYR